MPSVTRVWWRALWKWMRLGSWWRLRWMWQSSMQRCRAPTWPACSLPSLTLLAPSSPTNSNMSTACFQIATRYPPFCLYRFPIWKKERAGLGEASFWSPNSGTSTPEFRVVSGTSGHARPYTNSTLAESNKPSLLQALQSRGTDADQSAEKQLTSLLTVPLDKYPVVTVLGLSHYPSVMNLLPPATRKVFQWLSALFIRESCIQRSMPELSHILELVHQWSSCVCKMVTK